MLCLGPAAQHSGDFNSARILDEVWMFGMPEHSPVVMRNKIRVMQMQGSSYIKGLEGLRILPSEGLEVKRRGAEVRISRARYTANSICIGASKRGRLPPFFINAGNAQMHDGI